MIEDHKSFSYCYFSNMRITLNIFFFKPRDGDESQILEGIKSTQLHIQHKILLSVEVYMHNSFKQFD